MAPPKRKTGGGRVTPKGTRPGDRGSQNPSTDEHGQVWTYLDVDLPITWSGDLLAGADPILDLYVHAGFAPIWHYERVLALDLENGRVERIEDRSAAVAEFRDDQTDDDNVFERLLKAIRLRLPGRDD